MGIFLVDDCYQNIGITDFLQIGDHVFIESRSGAH